MLDPLTQVPGCRQLTLSECHLPLSCPQHPDLECSVPAGAPRVNLLFLTDCLLSHARRLDAPACIRDLPAMAGAGLPRMLQLAVSDSASLERVRRALDAWGRKGLLEPGYLKLGTERLAALAKAVERGAAGTAAAAESQGHQGDGQSAGHVDGKRQVRVA